MKSCPTCGRTYADDTLTFCLIDGSVLSAPYDPQTNQPYYKRETEPPPTEMFRSSYKSTDTISSSPEPTIQEFRPVYISNSGQPQSTKGSLGKPLLAVGIAVLIVTTVGLAAVLGWRIWLRSHNSTDKKPEINTLVSNANITAAPTPDATTRIFPTPQNSSTPATKLDVTGTWAGTSDKAPATLIINSSEGDSYEGVEIAGTNKVQMSVSIYVNPATKSITIKELRVIKGSGWNLGVNNGSISSNGRNMSGTAKDTKGKVYSWSFSKK